MTTRPETTPSPNTATALLAEHAAAVAWYAALAENCYEATIPSAAVVDAKAIRRAAVRHDPTDPDRAESMLRALLGQATPQEQA